MHFFDEIKSYVGFTDADARRLRRLGPVVEPYIEGVVVAFYDALMAHPRARGVFEGPEQILRLRRALQVWLRELFCGAYDQAYLESRRRIGRAHVDVGLLPQFMFGAMNLIRSEFTEVFLGQEARALEQILEDGEGGKEAVVSLGRILDIELTIMLQSYWDVLMKQKLEIPAALATGLAHEVRNPLNAISLQMTLLERKLRGAQVASEVYEPVVEAVRAELRRIQGLNAEILDFAKPVVIEYTRTDLGELIDELKRSHQLTLDAGDVRMSVEKRGNLVLDCDRDRLTQVFVNLLTNAVEAMAEGGEIRVELEERPRGVVVEFADTGEGMPPSQRQQAFDLFYTSKAAGTGIGLPIARKIVEAHGGSMDLISRPGEGTIFTIYLPVPAWKS